jgi:predicted ATP-grasp superfamily ATP-dependent carboligase
MYLIAGWRQWADAGSMSSGLPLYLIQQTKARQIGAIDPKGFYMFQIPGTHDLVRPIVRFDNGYPKTLETPKTTIHYTGDDQIGIVFLLGDEPHLDIERYAAAVLQLVDELKITRVISLAGVYGELPYEKQRTVSCIYSLKEMEAEFADLAVTFSDYEGGASIGSFLCRRAQERKIEYVGFYAFVPTYDFSNFAAIGNAIRIENDFMAWLGVMQRLNYMLKTDFDLTEIAEKSLELTQALADKIDDLDEAAPDLGIKTYMEQLAEDFEEATFDPLGDVWEEELRRLLDDDEVDDEDA